MNSERRNLSSQEYEDMKAMLAELTPAERRSLHDPNFITEDEADGIIASRRDGPYTSLDDVLREEGIHRRKISA